MGAPRAESVFLVVFEVLAHSYADINARYRAPPCRWHRQGDPRDEARGEDC
jgi:hypothetical protein